tara:strand:- start:235 stop:1941 length:1707 start_codon:yes stop_codon:yes gene_type:complete
MATKLPLVLPYIQSDAAMNLTLQSIKDNKFSDTVSNKAFYHRLKNVDINDITPSKQEDYERRIKYLMDNIPIEKFTDSTTYETPLLEALQGNTEKLIQLLEGAKPRQNRRRREKFNSFLNKHPQKEKFLSYVNSNEKLKNSIIGQTLGLSTSAATGEIKQRNDIVDAYAIEYLEFIMTTRELTQVQRRKLFPKDSENRAFEPIMNLTKLFPALNFLLKNEEFDLNFNWKNEAPNKMRQELVLSQLASNLELVGATGVQGLFNDIVTRQKTSRKGLEDTPDMVSSTKNTIGRFRNIDKFFEKLNKDNDAKEEFNNMIENTRSPSKALLDSDWELVKDLLEGKDGSRKALKDRLNVTNILAIEKVSDIRKIFGDKKDASYQNKKDAFIGMSRIKGAKITESEEDTWARRMKNQQDLELLEDLFYKTQKSSEILMANIKTDQTTKFKTFLTDGKYNPSREELPDIIEFLESVEEDYNNVPYAEVSSPPILGNAFKIVDKASNEEMLIDGILASPLEEALKNLLTVCAKQYKPIRKSFINAIKDSMVSESKRNSTSVIMDWFKDKNLLEEST